MIKDLLLKYKQLLKEREKALLELDGYKLGLVLKKEEELLKKLAEAIDRSSNLPSDLRSLAEEVYSFHEEVAKLTFSVIETLSEGVDDEHLLNVQYR